MNIVQALALALLLSGPAPTAPQPTLAAPAAPSGARMVLDATTADVGEVTRPAKLVHDFIVKNTGTGDLHLAVAPRCGCTVATIDEVVKPGTSGKITLAVDTTRFEGRVNKMATLTTNDPEHASVELAVGGTIKVPPAAPAAVASAATTGAIPAAPVK